MKIKLAAILMILAMLLGVAACNGGGNGNDSGSVSDGGGSASDGSGSSNDGGEGSAAVESITLNVWHSFIDEGETSRITSDEFIAEYMAANPHIKIVEETLESESYKIKIDMEFTGSASGIDVFTYWGGGRGGDIYNAGKLLNFEDYLSPGEIAQILPEADLNFRYDGALGALPLTSWMMVLYCNTELFEQYNVKLPETYDEWKAACIAFDAAGIIPVALGGGLDESWQAAFAYEALINRIVGADATMDLLSSMSGFNSNPGYVKAAELMVELNSVNAFGRNPLEIDYETANAQFFTGIAAMRLTGSWLTGDIDEEHNLSGKVKPMPIPLVPGGNGSATDYVGGIIDGVFINANTKYPEESVKFAYAWSLALAKAQHEAGEGFTPYTAPVDESDYSDLAKEVSAIAKNVGAGVLAWDTFLPGADADVHLNACQMLLKPNADIPAVLSEYNKIFN